MRIQRQLRTLALVAGWVAGAAHADVDLGPVLVSGFVEAGGRGISGDDDSGKFEEYRDPQEGLFGALDLMLENSERLHYLRFGGFDLGEEDADYFLEAGRWGHWGVSGSFSQLPHNYSNRALTPYFGVTGGDLRLPFAPPADAATFESSVTGAARDAKLGFDTDEGTVGLWLDPTSDTELKAGYRIIDRSGRRPDTLFYGFSNFVHFPEPVDETIHEGTADLSFSGERFNLALNYTASFFENDFRSMRVQNPAAFAGGSVLGAIAADPDNSAHLVSLTGSAALPVSFPFQVAGTLAYGVNRQTERFVPLTVNPDLAPAPLPANDLHGDVRPFLANFLLTARPLPKLEVRGRYRLRDYDNHSDEILFTETSSDDSELTAETKRSFAPSYTTQLASLETAYRITSGTKATLGFAWDRWDRGLEREVREMDEYTPELRFDTRAGRWANLRASYSFRIREADGYDELAPFRQVEPGEPQTPLTPHIRKYDEADNHRHDVRLRSQIFAREDTDLTLSSGLHITDWDDHFGLVSDDGFDVGFDAAYRPHPQVEISVYYTYDWSQFHQRSASSSGTLVWKSDNEDVSHTGGFDVALAVVPDRLTFTTGFFVHRGNGETHASGAPADAVDFPDVEDSLWSPTASLDFRYNEHLNFIAAYRFEHYDQNDWQFDGLGVTRLTSSVEGQPLLGTNNDVYLRNGLEDYAASVFSLAVVYKF